jgi:hypothetical protein
MISKKNFFLSIILLVVFLPGCGNNQSLAAQSVEEYFQAIVEKNQDMLVSKVCTSYEPNAMMDFNTFAIVKTSLENFSCQTTTTNENGYDVKCQGSLQAKFGDELRTFDLSKRTFQVVEENGNWLICGHTDLE